MLLARLQKRAKVVNAKVSMWLSSKPHAHSVILQACLLVIKVFMHTSPTYLLTCSITPALSHMLYHTCSIMHALSHMLTNNHTDILKHSIIYGTVGEAGLVGVKRQLVWLGSPPWVRPAKQSLLLSGSQGGGQRVVVNLFKVVLKSTSYLLSRYISCLSFWTN